MLFTQNPVLTVSAMRFMLKVILLPYRVFELLKKPTGICLTKWINFIRNNQVEYFWPSSGYFKNVTNLIGNMKKYRNQGDKISK